MENETERAAREQRYAEHDAYVLNFHNEQLTRLRGEAVDALLLAQPHITNPEHAAIEAAQTVDAVFAILTPYYDEQVAHAVTRFVPCLT